MCFVEEKKDEENYEGLSAEEKRKAKQKAKREAKKKKKVFIIICDIKFFTQDANDNSPFLCVFSQFYLHIVSI